MIAKRLVVIGFCMGLLAAPYTKTMSKAEINAKIADLQKKLAITKVADSKREIQSEITRYQGMLGQAPIGGGGGGGGGTQGGGGRGRGRGGSQIQRLTSAEQDDLYNVVDFLSGNKKMSKSGAQYLKSKDVPYWQNLISAAIADGVYTLPKNKTIIGGVQWLQDEAADVLAGRKEEVPFEEEYEEGPRETYPMRGVSRKVWNQNSKQYDDVITAVENLRSAVNDEASMRAFVEDVTNAAQGNWRAAGAEYTGVSKKRK